MLPKYIVDKVKTRWLDLWHNKLADGADAHCQMWYQAIRETLERAGWEFVSHELRSEERALSDTGLSHDYITALVDLTGADASNPMQLVTASPEQRMQACKVVRAYQNEQLRLKGDH